MRSREDRLRESASRSLLDYCLSNAKTVMIGALHACEEHMGELWGHGLEEEELTEEQKEFREVWAKVRTEILDNGNDRMASMEKEFGYFVIKNKRFKYEFKLGNRNDY